MLKAVSAGATADHGIAIAAEVILKLAETGIVKHNKPIAPDPGERGWVNHLRNPGTRR